MWFLLYLPAITSSLFRLASYVFLRVIPSRLGKTVLPVLYLSHLASSWFLSPSFNKYLLEQEKDDKKIRKAVTPTVSNRDSFRILLLSLPSPSPRLQIANFLINAILILATADFIVTPFLDTASDVVFTRLGAVNPDSVKIVTRYPQIDGTNIRVVYRELQRSETKDADTWKDGPVLTLTEEHDWVDTVKLPNLWPNTTYEYTFSMMNRTTLPYPPTPIRFRTFPDPRLPAGNRFRFVVSSCMTPNHPYNGPLHRRTIRGFDLLADYLFPPGTNTHVQESSHDDATSTSTSSKLVTTLKSFKPIQAVQNPVFPSTEFLLFLGDFIYADVPLYIGDNEDAYRRLYRRNYQSDSFRRVYQRLPILHAYDDHEFINNFGGNGNDSTPPYLNASNAFKIYNANANHDPPTPGHHYYEFRYGDVAFFVMDTRRYRSDVKSDFSTRTMLGDSQLVALYDWLSRVNATATFKFVVSSVPFTSLWGHDAVSDSWAGFPSEKTALLEAFHTVPNVIVLSGDRHEFAAIEFNSPNQHGHTVHEFSTSPLSMFYIPFIHTLRMRSEDTIQRIRMDLNLTDDGPRPITIAENIPRERVLKYIPTGNYKWSTIEIDTRDMEKPILQLETMIDGKPGYHLNIIGTPVKVQTSTALGAFVAGGVKDILERLGIRPAKWF